MLAQHKFEDLTRTSKDPALQHKIDERIIRMKLFIFLQTNKLPRGKRVPSSIRKKVSQLRNQKTYATVKHVYEILLYYNFDSNYFIKYGYEIESLGPVSIDNLDYYFRLFVDLISGTTSVADSYSESDQDPTTVLFNNKIRGCANDKLTPKERRKIITKNILTLMPKACREYKTTICNREELLKHKVEVGTGNYRNIKENRRGKKMFTRSPQAFREINQFKKTSIYSKKRNNSTLVTDLFIYAIYEIFDRDYRLIAKYILRLSRAEKFKFLGVEASQLKCMESRNIETTNMINRARNRAKEHLENKDVFKKNHVACYSNLSKLTFLVKNLT